jgi:hypothetical protein
MLDVIIDCGNNTHTHTYIYIGNNMYVERISNVHKLLVTLCS